MAKKPMRFYCPTSKILSKYLSEQQWSITRLDFCPKGLSSLRYYFPIAVGSNIAEQLDFEVGMYLLRPIKLGVFGNLYALRFWNEGGFID